MRTLVILTAAIAMLGSAVSASLAKPPNGPRMCIYSHIYKRIICIGG